MEIQTIQSKIYEIRGQKVMLDYDLALLYQTETRTLKQATLETGATLGVPLFVNEGELIRVNTKTGEYVERVKS